MPVDSIENSAYYQAERRNDARSPEELERRKAYFREQQNREIEREEMRRAETLRRERDREVREREMREEEIIRDEYKGRHIDEIV